MNYLVIELQTSNGETANIVTKYATLPIAQQAFYTVCAAAVVSTVDTHSVVLMDEAGFVLKNECFKHLTEGGN